MAVDFTKFGIPLTPDEAKRFEKDEMGAIQGLVQDIARPFLRGFETGRRGIGGVASLAESGIRRRVGDEEGAERASERAERFATAPPTKFGFLGEAAPLSGVREAAGAGAQIGATLLGGGGVRQIAQAGLKGAIRRGAVEGTRVGATAGGLFSGGEALERGAPAGEVAGQAALGAGIGAAGGGLIGGGIPFASFGTKKGVGFISNTFRKAYRRLRPLNREVAINNLTEGYFKSFVEGNPAITKALEPLVLKGRRFGGPADERGLLRELAEEGYIPVVEGRLLAKTGVARMRPVIDAISDRIGQISEAIDEFLVPIKTKISLNSMRERAGTILKGRGDVDLDKSLRQLETLFKSLQTKHGSNISAVSVNAIRKQMNKATKAFKKEEFIQDTADAVADVTREILDEVDPSKLGREARAQTGKLFRLKNTARILNNKPIDAGFIGESIGRFIGVTGGAAAGFSVAGPGGLVIAGVAANLGSKAVAQMIRRFRFNPQVTKIIGQALREDKRLMSKLLKGATPEDAAVIRESSRLLPGGAIAQPAARQRQTFEARVVSAKKDTGRDPKTGRFKKVFLSTGQEGKIGLKTVVGGGLAAGGGLAGLGVLSSIVESQKIKGSLENAKKMTAKNIFDAKTDAELAQIFADIQLLSENMTSKKDEERVDSLLKILDRKLFLVNNKNHSEE